ncbi:MAG: thioredoxin family protein, partial [archaeon]
QTSLTSDVKLTLFTQQHECESCKSVQLLVKEIASASDRITLDLRDLEKDSDYARILGVNKTPVILIMKNDDGPRIRFFGSPEGHELRVFVDDIIRVSKGESGLSDETKRLLKSINKPIHIQVFVTPNCPYCPKVTTLAHQIALENKVISADVIEVTTFPELAQKYSVMSVPNVVINESVRFTGVLPENKFLEKILSAVK